MAECDKCGKTAVYFRANEGAHYCSSCLSRQVERSFTREIGRDKLKKGDVVAVGVSGGKDSMTLLYLMSKLSKKVRVKIIALTIDEGIAGYRNKSIAVVKEFAEKLGVEHHVFSFRDFFEELDGMKVDKYCTYCGVFRRKLLNQKARELGATRLAVGHNLDDEAQSILMNVLRGDTARMKRLSKTKKDARFVTRIKPLRDVPEKEIVAYAFINDISYFDGECPYSGNNVRRDVQTLLNDFEAKYPGTKNQIVKFHDKISIKERSGKVNYCKKCGEPASGVNCKACELISKVKMQ